MRPSSQLQSNPTIVRLLKAIRSIHSLAIEVKIGFKDDIFPDPLAYCREDDQESPSTLISDVLSVFGITTSTALPVQDHWQHSRRMYDLLHLCELQGLCGNSGGLPLHLWILAKAARPTLKPDSLVTVLWSITRLHKVPSTRTYVSQIKLDQTFCVR